MAAALAQDDHAYVLVDGSGQYAPTDWARQAVGLYHRLQPDRIVAQTNFDGSMAEATVRVVDQNVFFTGSRHRVAKSRGPAVAALYEQHRVRHVWSFPELEDQVCSFTIAFDRRTAGFSLSPGPVDA